MKTELELTKTALDARKMLIEVATSPHSTFSDIEGAYRHTYECMAALKSFKTEQEKESQYDYTITVEKSGEITRTPV